VTEFIKMYYEEWVATYKPIDNKFNPGVAGGQLFQMPCSDEERAFLQTVERSKIWSYGAGDYGGTYVWSGEFGQGSENYGAYVTEIGYEGDAIIEVEFFEPEFECPRCQEFWSGEDVITQRRKYEDSCEKCATEDDLIG